MERVALNVLRNVPGAARKAIRIGRGRSSRRPRTAGRGMIGQKARENVSPEINGGQTPIYFKIPKHGMSRRNPEREYAEVNLHKLQEFVQAGRLDPTKIIDMKALAECNIAGHIKYGVKLLARGAEKFNLKVNLRVSKASKAAIAAVEKAGGTIECIYYGPVGLRALLKPEKFIELPRPALPRRGLREWYENPDNRGYLSKTTAKAALAALRERDLAENAAAVAAQAKLRTAASVLPGSSSHTKGDTKDTAPVPALDTPPSAQA